MTWLHPSGVHVDPNTGIVSVLYSVNGSGDLKIWETSGVWSVADEDDYTIPGLFATADEALENAEAHLRFQYDD